MLWLVDWALRASTYCCRAFHCTIMRGVVDVVLGLYVPPTAKFIRRHDLDLKSHPKDFARGKQEYL